MKTNVYPLVHLSHFYMEDNVEGVIIRIYLKGRTSWRNSKN